MSDKMDRQMAGYIADYILKELVRVRSQNYGELNLTAIRNLVSMEDLILQAVDAYKGGAR